MKTFTLCFLVLLVAQVESPPAPSGGTTTGDVVQSAPRTAPAIDTEDVDAAQSPFITIPISIDPQGEPLAAYQVEITAKQGTFKVVGLEVGPALRDTFPGVPRYDRAVADAGPIDRLIVADFSLAAGDALPNGPTTVAIVHAYVEGLDPDDPNESLTVTLQAAATLGGAPIDQATANLTPIGDPS